ncbi:hypothetical protein ARAM_003761 [Aspergillus rambellii]|uniref:Multicopper oxidase n=1 Tax=Aspergillus rambellii TaxID=308745 RepID=A0A0F8X042_9EURO|nr:hypothetical protein ARAM_003761 [Aspergillus rambellii]
MNWLLFALCLLWHSEVVFCKDVYLNWKLTWVNAGPDEFQRPVIGINGEWPCPQVDLHLGDRLIADVYNGLGNQSTGIHWHGMHQFGSPEMDGANGVTQCPIEPGQHMRYDFQVNQTGTFWYHSHQMGQYPDGLRGPLILHDTKPLPFQYDEEITVTVSDWYHKQMGELVDEMEEVGVEPTPDAILFNEATNTTLKVDPGKTYLIRLICMGNWAGHSVTFEDHDITIVEVDGVLTNPHYLPPQLMRIAPGQRMSVLITTKDDTSRNYGILDAMDIVEMFVHENRSIPAGFNPNGTAWLVYDEQKPLPPAPTIHVTDASVDFFNDLNLVSYEPKRRLEPVDRQIILNISQASQGRIAAFTINDQVYEEPTVPTLYTAMLATPEQAPDPSIYGSTNPYVVKYGEVVEIVINNFHSNLHAWHFHGHTPQIIQRGTTYGGYFEGYFPNISSTPLRRDTIMVEPKSHLVFRFRAKNIDKCSLPPCEHEILTCFYASGCCIATQNSTLPHTSLPPLSRPPKGFTNSEYRKIIGAFVLHLS